MMRRGVLEEASSFVRYDPAAAAALVGCTDSLWDNTVFVKDNVVEEIQRLKQQDGSDLHVYGSSQLLQTLFKHDLVDELWLKVFPITLGTGKRLFGGGTISAALRLTRSEATRSGVTIASYERAGDVKTGSFEA